MPIRIFIDPGHNPTGGPNTGAEGNGLREQDVNYTVGSYLAELLRADARFAVRLSRNTPTESLGTSNATSLAARVNAANSWPADYFISIHCNANVNPAVNGSEVYVYQQNTQQLEQSHDALAATDELLLKLDEALQDPLGESAAAFYEQHESEVQQCLASLDEAEKNATDAAAGLRETLERTAADNLMSASSARRTMFDAGWEILEQAQGMRSAYQQMQDIWQQVLDADAQAREAAHQASSGSRDAISAGKDLEAQAKTKLEETAAELEEFAQENTEVDVFAFQAYVAKRIEALGYAIASDEALEARDTQKATENNDAYNAADEEAAGLAATLPADPGQPVLDAMEELSANAVETYEAARAQASTSDAFLRDYFGSSER